MKDAPILALVCVALICGGVFSPGYALASGPQTNLSVAVQAPANPVIAGTAAQYHVTTTNQGPAQAVSVVTTLTLPAGMAFVSVVPATNCAHAAGVVTCTQATLDLNESMIFTVNTAIAADARGTLLVSGATSSRIPDPDQNNNTRAVATVVQPEIDLHLELAGVQPAVAIAGVPLIYQLRVSNNGRSTATNTVLQMNLPANTVEPGVSSSAGTQCALLAASISCALGTVAPAGVVNTSWITSGTVITVAVQLRAELLASNTLLVGVAIDGEELEANTANNFIYYVNQVDRLTDVGLQVSDAGTQLISGSAVVYTFVARNYGPSNHDGVVFSSVFSNGFDVQQATGTNCTFTLKSVTCVLGTLTPGQEATIVVRGRVRSAVRAPLQLTAEVRGTDAEPQAGSANSVLQTVPIIPHVVFIPVTVK